MIHLASLRSVVRRLGLRSLVSPLVTLIEEWRFRQLGRYQVEQTTPGTLVFTGFGRQVSMSGLPRAQCELGLSSHERATILAVLSRASSGDCVWDVGANVGFYTRLLSAVVAESGRVFAFEPNASTFQELQEHVAGLGNVTAVCQGLSDEDGVASFAAPADHSSASRIMSDTAKAAGELAQIVICRGDTLMRQGGVQVPRFAKVDVEGHELQALRGMAGVLSDPGFRCVLVEVHFSLLEEAGQSSAPGAIQKLLHDCGLTRQQWISRSHLLAEK